MKEFDIQLMHGQRNVFSTDALITKHFKSATGRFIWTDVPKDTWRADREGVCHVPGALAGMTLQIGRFSGKPIVIEEWDGQSFELP